MKLVERTLPLNPGEHGFKLLAEDRLGRSLDEFELAVDLFQSPGQECLLGLDIVGLFPGRVTAARQQLHHRPAELAVELVDGPVEPRAPRLQPAPDLTGNDVAGKRGCLELELDGVVDDLPGLAILLGASAKLFQVDGQSLACLEHLPQGATE